MAQRPAFFPANGAVASKSYSFTWFPGFSLSQKQKSIESLHRAIREADPAAVPLEVSTKSPEPLGILLSAFRLKLDGYPLENVFQSAKVFEQGGPYPDLLGLPPGEAKRDLRLQNSGPLTAFQYQGQPFPLTPRTAFYDFLYLAAVRQSLEPAQIRAIGGYTHFTDIEYNPAKSLNTQARAVALIPLLLARYGSLPELSWQDFIRFHQACLTD